MIMALMSILTPAIAAGADDDQWDNPDLSDYTNLPITVKVGIHLDQITHVNQRAENFGAVGDIRIEWRDHNLEFTPENQALPIRRFSATAFAQKNDPSSVRCPEGGVVVRRVLDQR